MLSTTSSNSGSSLFANAFPNVTLTSGELAVTVYLPRSLATNDDEQVFYESSRFEHGSMIGSITRRKKSTKTSGAEKHELYGTDLWRTPHNPFWPESGVGLASEFGVGDDGDFCTYRCGWYGVNNVTNGVLGYPQARTGEPFLKIGVGALIKGSCQACDITDGYKFNSPYRFASIPLWSMYQPSVGHLILEHEAHLGKYGYRLKKDIKLEEDTLLVTTTLTNLGVEAFSTVWYSHHFFSCDSKPIGPGYQVEMDLKDNGEGNGDVHDMYDEPGVMASWSRALRKYARVKAHEEAETVTVDMNRDVEPGTRIKAEFKKDERTSGAFAINACGTYMEEDIPELQNRPNDPVNMYGFNLYIERGTLSPEPQLLLHLQSSHSKTWTQRLVFSDSPSVVQNDQQKQDLLSQKYQQSLVSNTGFATSKPKKQHRQTTVSGLFVLLIVSIGAFALLAQRGRQRRYRSIPDAPTESSSLLVV